MSSNRGCCTKQKANTNKAQLGVYIEDLSIEKAQEIKLKNTNGAYVSGLSNNSAAAEAGIQENDVIVTIDKTTINDYNGLVRVLANYQPNDVVKVKYVRNGKKQKTKVTLKGKEQNCCKIQTTCPKNEVEKIKKEIIIIQGDETQIIENDGEEMIFINGQDIDKESITRLIEGHNDNVLVKEMMIEVAENENSAPEKVKLIVIVTNPSEKETIILQEIIEENQQTVAKNINPTNVLTVNDLSFYPNPSDGKFEVNFNLSNKGNTTVRIVDLAGKMVFQEELGNFSGNYTKQIDISDKGKGVYLLQIVQDEKMMTKKILVQ